MVSKNSKRDHKKAVRRRNARVTLLEDRKKEKMWENVIKSYANGSDVMPMPTLVDALSIRDLDKAEKVQEGVEVLLKYFNDYIEKSAKEYEAGINLPESVVSFIIPLDFYLPLPEPYNATSISLTDNDIDRANCITIVSDIVDIADSAVKVSYLVASICMDEHGEITDLSDKKVFKIFEQAIRECNAIIAAFQAIPTRHNHYLHRITEQSCPGQIDAIIFNRKSGEILRKETVSFTGNVQSEIFQSRSLDEAELNQFRIAHVNKTFLDDKIFDLVSKYNDAINTRCFGHNDEAILLADSFVELTIGYLYCEARIFNGDEKDEVIQEYADTRTIGELVGLFAQLLGMSNSEFRRQVGFDTWYKYCRDVRNDLTHRFMTGGADHDESLNTLHYSGALVVRLCRVLQQKYSLKSFPEFYDKLDLLISASYFVSVLHRGRFGEK